MAPSKERTFIMVKPDGVQRGFVHKVMKRFEQKGYKLTACKMMQGSLSHLQVHYQDLKGKPFFDGLCRFMSDGPVVCFVFEGLDVVKQGRRILGETDPKESLPGSLRGDFATDLGRNIVHGSDSVASAEREIKHWFKDEEICNWEMCSSKWVYE